MIECQNDLISIIMSVYNVESYLERSLNSVLNQTYKNWELLIVNDGSTDRSKEICLAYAEKDKRIVYLEQENQGISVTRNLALKHCKGKYICYVDADDWAEPDFLQELYNAIKDHDSEIAICGFYSFDDKCIKTYSFPFDKQLLTCSEFRSKLIKNEIQSFMWNKIFDKNIFNGVEFIPGVSFQDMSFFDEILPKLRKDVPVINKPLYYYNQRTTSAVHIRKLKRELDYFRALKSRYELDYITKEEKAYCLKYLLIGFYYFYQIKDFNQDVVDNCKNYIKQAPNYLFAKAKKLLTKKELVRFSLAFYCPIVYRTLFNIYRFIEKIRGNK